jgi:hypothetical protein
MDTTPLPAHTQETSEHQTAKRVTTASNDPFHIQRNTLPLMPNLRQKLLHPNFIPENPFSILQTEHEAQTTTTSEISTTRQEKKKFPNYHYITN